MKCTTIIDKDREEEVVIYLHGENEISAKIEALVSEGERRLVGYEGDSMLNLSPGDISCFFTDGGRVYALIDKRRVRVKERLYELEEMLGAGFVKINQSCLANIKMIKRFDVTLGGALRVEFKNGYRDYVSRRQMKTVKERFLVK